jgi:hypothetical protein
MMHIRVRAAEIGSFSVALLKLMSLAPASNARGVHRVKIPQASVRNSRL